jgi:Ca2+-binding EF-hand superfamily protein
LSFADTDENSTISFDEWTTALQRLGFDMNEDGARAMFQP